MSQKQLQTAEDSLARSKRQRIDFTDCELTRVDPDFRPIADSPMWSLVDAFFGALLDYRAEQWSRDENKIHRLSLQLIERLGIALFHPLFKMLKSEVTFLTLPILFASSCEKNAPGLAWRYFQTEQMHHISFDTLPGASRLKSLTRPGQDE